MKRIAWLVLILLAVGTTASAANPFRKRPAAARSQSPQSAEHRTHCAGWLPPVETALRPDDRPLVWVLDGAGDLKGCSNALAAVNDPLGRPVELAVFPWSHGYRRLLADQTDTAHARAQGFRLAQAIQDRKAREPGRRVVVVGHSAGCAVALAGCDLLPVDFVDRVLLLAPSVSTGYDIRPTLWSAKEGVDVFCSRKDWVALGFVTRVVGTTDDSWSRRAAGRWGFEPRGAQRLAPVEAARLRQHFWSPDAAWTGHTGGHHGMHAPGYVRAYLMPLMTGPEAKKS
jgi:hypothetical protein